MSRILNDATHAAAPGLLRRALGRPASAALALALSAGLMFGAAPAEAGGRDAARAVVGVAAVAIVGAAIIGALDNHDRGYDRGRVVYAPRRDDYYDRGRVVYDDDYYDRRRGQVVVVTRPQTVYRSAPVRVIGRGDGWRNGRDDHRDGRWDARDDRRDDRRDGRWDGRDDRRDTRHDGRWDGRDDRRDGRRDARDDNRDDRRDGLSSGRHDGRVASRDDGRRDGRSDGRDGRSASRYTAGGARDGAVQQEIDRRRMMAGQMTQRSLDR